jgi:hypothetical protein
MLVARGKRAGKPRDATKETMIRNRSTFCRELRVPVMPAIVPFGVLRAKKSPRNLAGLIHIG